MFKFSIKSSCVGLNWSTDFKEIKDFFIKDPFFKVHFPDAFLVDELDIKDENKFKIFHQIGKNFKLDLNKDQHRLKIIQPQSLNINPAQYVFLCVPLLSRLFEENNLYRLHMAGIEKNNKTILLAGDTKSGKSILASTLVLKNGFHFLADECCVLNFLSGNIVAGNDVISLRNDSVDGNFFPKIKNYLLNRSKVTTKYYLELPKKFNNKAPVVFIVEPHFSEWGASKIEKVSSFDTAILLYENISSSIRSTLSFLFLPEIGFPSLDNQELANKRIKRIKEFISRFRVVHYSITGNLASICRFIDKLTM